MSSFINFKNFDDTSHPEQLGTNSSLARQSSIYSLTFDELQNTLGTTGKDFGSMNMDELLKNIWTAEETQAMTSTSNFGNAPAIQRQGSLTLPRTLSQKTVDEVWKELYKSSNGEVKDNGLIDQINFQQENREPTLGEMTLEDFLLKAGVVTENNHFGDISVSQPNVENSSFIFGFQNQIIDSKNGLTPKPKPQPIFPKQAALDFTAPLTGQTASPRGKMGNFEHSVKTSVVQGNGVGVKSSPRNLIPKSNFDSTPSPPFYAFGEGGLHGRKSSGTLEKVVERRRRRMIKNRESAARSRARKQVSFYNENDLHCQTLSYDIYTVFEISFAN